MGEIILMPLIMHSFPSPSERYTVFGIESTKPLTSSKSGFSEMVAAGSVWFRRNVVLWESVEPERGIYNWQVLQSLEQEIELAAEQNVNLILVVRGTPQWAQKIAGYSCAPMKEENFVDFGNFMYELVRRYNQLPFRVQYWELWNEPDVPPALVLPDSPFGCWGDASEEYYGGGYYAEMLKSVYPRVKEANRDAKLMVGGLQLDCDPHNVPRHKKDCESAKFLEGILRNGGGAYFDGVGFHSYDYYYGEFYYENPNWHASSKISGPVMVAKATYLLNLLRSYGYPGKFLINAETALLCAVNCDTDKHAISLAYYLTHSYGLAKAYGLRASLWYSVFGWLGSGLLERSLEQRPAYLAYHFANQEIGSTNFIREVVDYPNVRVLEFEREDLRIWLLWSLDGSPHTVQLPKQPIAIWDALGIPQPFTGNVITVTPKPLYIEW